jgi:putative ABC transport system permease protein
MFKSYLTVTWRNIKRYKGYSFINIIGLAVGMACCLLIIMYISDELSYDGFFENSNRIYRVNTISSIGASKRSFAVVPSVFAPGITGSIPEIESAVRVMRMGSPRVEYNNTEYELPHLIMADPAFFHIFSYQFIAGNPETSLEKPGSIVITEAMARIIFDNQDPIGKSIIPFIGGDAKPLEITGVIKEVPRNSQLQFSAVIPLTALQYMTGSSQPPDFLLDPYYCRLHTYFLFDIGIDITSMEKKINQTADTKWGEIYAQRGTTREFFLMNIKDIHLFSPNEDEPPPKGDINNVYLFAAIALLVLLIACFNFINLSTARSANRAAEVSIRKVIGSQRSQLINQFLSESIILSFIGLFISILLVILVLPAFNLFVGKEIQLKAMLNPNVFGGIIGIVILTGLVAGSFPALILSAFDPVRVLKGKFQSASRNYILRKTLVIFQFSISIFLIIGILTIIRQFDYIKNKDLGFGKEQIVVFNSFNPRTQVLRNKIRENPNVILSCFSRNVPGVFRAYQGYNTSPTDTDKETLRAYQIIADYDFVNTYGLEIIWGRNFSRNYSTDLDRALIINKKAAEILGWSGDAIGKTLYNMGENNRPSKVIGIVNNFHHTSLREEISPVIIELDPASFGFVSVRIKSDNVAETLQYLGSVFKEDQPDQEFNYYFIDDAFANMYPEEEKAGQFYLSFGFLAIFVACLGLFGLSSFTIAQRTKEIGVRKILGASMRELLVMISKDFLLLVLASNLIAWPLAYFIMQGWLRNFAYRISISWDIFLISAVLAFMIAAFTISFQSIKAAVSNPIDSLRFE